MATASRRKVFELFTLLSITTIILYFMLKPPSKDEFRLLECNGISKCVDIAIFYNREICEEMKISLDAAHLIFKYACEKVK